MLQKFRLAAQDKNPGGRVPPQRLRKRIETYFDPLPFYFEPIESQLTDKHTYPLNALTQRPMAMYHSWDSQNAWLRQIHTYNFMHVHPSTAKAAGIADGGWMWAESMHGKVRCLCRYSEAVEPGTIWTWNAIGKASGAWNLDGNANESKQGFLLNHLISEELPSHDAGEHISNSDPVTGQAGWFDVRVRIYPAGAEEEHVSFPQYQEMPAVPGTPVRRKMQQFFAGMFTKGAK